MIDQPPRVGSSETGGGFIENQQPRISSQCRGNGHQLFFDSREPREFDIGGDFAAGPQQPLTCLGPHCLPVDSPSPTPGPLLAQQHVLGHRQMATVLEFLVDRGDAQVDRSPRRFEFHSVTLPGDLAVGGTQHATDQSDQGRFARPVFSDQPENLTGDHRECRRLQGHHASKRTADSGQFEQRGPGG